jgi:Family of unknown function (DUF6263)
MRLRVALVICIVSVVFVAGCATIGSFGRNQDFLPRLQLEQGARYTGEYQENVSLTFAMAAQNIVQKVKRDVVFSLFVDSIEEGNMHVRYRFDKFDVDSRTLINGMPTPQFGGTDAMIKAVEGAELRVVLSPRGEVLEFKGMEALYERMAEASPLRSASVKKMVVDQLKAALSDETMRDMMLPSRGAYPKDAVPVGGSWAETFSMASVGFPMRTTFTYNLAERSGGKAFLNGELKIEPTDTNESFKIMGMAVRISMSGDGTFKSEMNQDDGMVTRTTSDSSFTGEMSILIDELDADTRKAMGIDDENAMSKMRNLFNKPIPFSGVTDSTHELRPAE